MTPRLDAIVVEAREAGFSIHARQGTVRVLKHDAGGLMVCGLIIHFGDGAPPVAYDLAVSGPSKSITKYAEMRRHLGLKPER